MDRRHPHGDVLEHLAGSRIAVCAHHDMPAAFLYMKLVTLSPKKACHFMDYRIFAMCLICCATAYACTTLFNGQWYIPIAIGMTMMLPVALLSVKARL